MHHSPALTAYGDSSSGTPVSLVVAPDRAAPGHSAPPPHRGLPFTGLELVPFLLLAAVLLAAGSLLTRLARRPAPARVRSGPRPRPARPTES